MTSKYKYKGIPIDSLIKYGSVNPTGGKFTGFPTTSLATYNLAKSVNTLGYTNNAAGSAYNGDAYQYCSIPDANIITITSSETVNVPKTITVPDNVTAFGAILIGGGGGGGGSTRADSNHAGYGGAGGCGAGNVTLRNFPIQSGTQITVTVGGGGTGGTGPDDGEVDAGAGNPGGDSSIEWDGIYNITANGGGGGGGAVVGGSSLATGNLGIGEYNATINNVSITPGNVGSKGNYYNIPPAVGKSANRYAVGGIINYDLTICSTISSIGGTCNNYGTRDNNSGNVGTGYGAGGGGSGANDLGGPGGKDTSGGYKGGDGSPGMVKLFFYY